MDNSNDTLNLEAEDLRVFVPAKSFEISKRFYIALGFSLNWQHEESLAEFEIAGHRFFLQNYFVEQWAHNFMISVRVSDTEAWYRHISDVLSNGDFGDARVSPPKNEPWGQRITYCIDPSGVLIHFSQPIPEK